ncbi:MAG: hypothetical protein KAT34_02210 [Candidatus Aminicenantes bacterium]|nr:hypothetical protein [Candidatus Aminicenantes bacterium]
MNLTIEVLAAFIAGIAALLSALFSLISFIQIRKNQKVSTFSEISALYDQLIGFRINHPEVLSLSRKWNSDMLGIIYKQANKKNKEWVKYYTFVELCIGYCNAVLHARKRKLIDKDTYENQHKPLVKLLLTEHNPIISDIIQERKYISPYIESFRQSLRKEGWNWEKEYEELAKSPQKFKAILPG